MMHDAVRVFEETDLIKKAAIDYHHLFIMYKFVLFHVIMASAVISRKIEPKLVAQINKA